MRTTRYNEQTVGRVVSMRCRRSPSNRDVVVIDNEKIQQVYVYDFMAIDDVITYLRDEMNIDIVAAPHSPIPFKLLHHQPAGAVYYLRHDDEQGDEFHAFFAPRDTEIP